MLTHLTAHPEQIRHYAQAALNGFTTLDSDDAVENARGNLSALLAYLSALEGTNEAVLVNGIASIKGNSVLEVRAR